MNLLVDPVLTLSSFDRVSLPALFAAMTRDEVRGFPALRPHQRPAWHMFLVQLAALSLWNAGHDDLPDAEAEWARAMRGLTPGHEDDAPWRLTVTDASKPAFMQASAPEGLKWSRVSTPDALDMLITARNHDLKQAIAREAEPEDWIYALVSLQTCEGFGGRGNYGIARMNGGSSSRPLFGLAPLRESGVISVDPSAWWARDVRYLLRARADGIANGIGDSGGHSLLWCLPWPEDDQLDLRSLDPLFIEICRRVRLREKGGRLFGVRSTSSGPRINAKPFKGNVGDPWIPVHQDGKSLTLGGGDFHYRRLCDLLFSGNWVKPLLARPRNEETGDMLLVAEAFARGNSKTEGFKSRVLLVPGKVLPLFSTESAGSLAAAQMQEIKTFQSALRYALALMSAGGVRDRIQKGHYDHASLAQARFDKTADRLFFPSLWRRIEAANQGDEEVSRAKRDFLGSLWREVQVEFEAALPAIPCSVIFRLRAEVRSRRALYSLVRKEFSELFEAESQNEAA